jgi:hypothetical protein
LVNKFSPVVLSTISNVKPGGGVKHWTLLLLSSHAHRIKNKKNRNTLGSSPKLVESQKMP